jgi:signal peptidase II
MTWLEPLAAGTAVLVADQLSKKYVLVQPRFSGAHAPRSFVSIRCVINRRAAVMPLPATWMRMSAWLLCAVFALIALWQQPSVVGATGIGLALGGITGNLIDLLRRGGIVDFIAIGPWPIFNLADAAIVLGLVLAILAMV